MKIIGKFFKYIIYSFLLWIFVKTFICQGFRVPSDSMLSTIRENDFVLIDKTAYGPRLPFTPLSLTIGSKSYMLDFIGLPYLRLPGYCKVIKNDILVFNLPTGYNLPIDHRKIQIKRCVASPGDTLVIRNGDIYINGKFLYVPGGVISNYTFNNLSDTTSLKKINPIKLSGIQREVHVSKDQADSLRILNEKIILIKKSLPKNFYNPATFPNSPLIKWNLDSIGPLFIPSKGSIIQLTDSNFALYKTVLEHHEKADIKKIGNQFYINGFKSNSYSFKFDYFFVLGDNRSSSIDSRYWGLLPEDHIIGKYILNFN